MWEEVADGKKKKKPEVEEEDSEQEGLPDQNYDYSMARKRSLLSETGGSCGEEERVCLSLHWPRRTAGRRARPGAVPSPRRLPRTAGKPPPAPGPVALDQPLRESFGDGGVQLAEAALLARSGAGATTRRRTTAAPPSDD